MLDGEDSGDRLVAILEVKTSGESVTG